MPFPSIHGPGTWLVVVVVALSVVGCAEDVPSATVSPSETQVDAQEAACRAARDVQGLLPAAGSDAGGEQVDRITEAVRELADAANRTDDPELRSNASHLLLEWERITQQQDQPTAPADAGGVSRPLQAIVAECERLGIRPEG